MRKGRDGEKREKNGGGKNGEKKKKKIRMKIVATTSLPAVNRPNADRWNATRSCQFLYKLQLKSCNCNFETNNGLFLAV